MSNKAQARKQVQALPVSTQRAIILMTPEKAAEFLARNRCNRKKQPKRVARLVRIIKAGHFEPNGQAICFDSEGYLIAGQHRLYAIVEAGKAVYIDVAYNVSARAAHSTNDGAGGNQANIAAALVQHFDVKSAVKVTSWLCAFYELVNGKIDQLTVDEAMEFFLDHEEAFRSVIDLKRLPQNQNHLGTAPVMSAFLFAWPTNTPSIRSFHEKIRTGLGYLKDGDPARTLREFSVDRFEAHSKEERTDRVLYCLWKHATASKLGRMPERLSKEGRRFFLRHYEE